MNKMLNRCRLCFKSEFFWLVVMLFVVVLALCGISQKLIIGSLVAVVIIRFFWTQVMDSEDKVRAALRNLMYLGVIVFYISFLGSDLVFSTGGFSGVIAILLRLILGGLIAAWLTPIICGKVSHFFGEVFYGFGEGGKGEKVEKKFLSSIPEGFRKRGKYQEALENIETQLRDLPDNLEGNLLKASIYADDLKDMPQAEAIIQEMLSSGNVPPSVGAHLYNRLADWRLNLCRDLEGAKAALQGLVNRYPGSEQALYAIQRKSHLCLPDDGKPKEKQVIRIVEDLGLKPGFKGWDMPQVSWQEEAESLVAYLKEHPHDWDAHEKLACIYSRHSNDVKAAVAELEELINQGEQPKKKVAQWLNLEADFYIRAYDLPGAQKALERISELYPGSAPAYMAAHRISLLKMELEKEKAILYEVPKTDPSLALKNDQRVAKVARETYAKRAKESAKGPISPREVIVSEKEAAEPVKESPAPKEDNQWVEEMEKLDEHLAQHPVDWESREELAAIYAYKCGEVSAAISQMELLIQAEGRTPNQIAKWLNREADFYLHAQDLDSARASLERIGQLLPDSSFVPLAQRRIMRLKMEVHKADRLTYEIPRRDEREHSSAMNLGGERIVKAVRDTRARQQAAGKGASPEVKESPKRLQKEEDSWKAKRQEYERRLIEFPQDWETREALATIYAYQEQNLGKALEQVEILLQIPGQPVSRQVQWLHREADFYLHARDLEGARAALERVGELFPTSPLVEIAQTRIGRLKLELDKDLPTPYSVPRGDAQMGLKSQKPVVKVVQETRTARKVTVPLVKTPSCESAQPMKKEGERKIVVTP